MTSPEHSPESADQTATASPVPSAPSTPMAPGLWWVVRLVSQPLLFFVAGAALLGLLGVAQKAGWISAGHSGVGHGPAAAASGVDYICPMMCTPPQKEQGRCPVCAMELVPASSGGGGDERSIVVDPASRRIANIQTASVGRGPVTQAISTVGELHYDEATLKTISAYSDGRFDRLYVDFTGAKVREGERLASFYSPELFSAQVEYLQAGKSLQGRAATSLKAVVTANERLLENSRKRLVELGMSDAQIAELDRTQDAQSRIDIVAPISGTVIEKLAVEGEYVREGQPVFRLADLSRVWLMLEVFPEDLALIRNGMTVEATMKSLPGREFSGHISYIDTDVDPGTRTVSVRVIMDNDEGLLRIGDYAKARIHVDLNGQDASGTQVASDHDPAGMLLIPRDAVLMAAGHCVVYVESEPGRFEIRRIVTGSASGDLIAVVKGLAEGEVVATAGNFLLDSQMQLAGNPSLIDPARAAPPMDMLPGFDAEMLAAIRQLPADDQPVAIEQVICPVTDFKLGSMGVPPKVIVEGQPVFLCCEGCRDRLMQNPRSHLQRLQEFREAGGSAQPPEDSEMLLPPIGPIEADLSDSSIPAIGDMEILPPEPPDQDAATERSAAGGTASGRVQ